jgi:hypothetical protein
VRPARIKEVNRLLTGVLQRPLQLRHRASGTKFGPRNWFGSTRSPLGKHIFFEVWAAFLRRQQHAGLEDRTAFSPGSSGPGNARCNMAAHFAIVA